MANLYLTEQGGCLRKRDRRLVFEKDGETLLERPMKDVDTVVVFGRIQVSVQALLALLEGGCDVSLMTHNGHFRGRLVPALGKNSPLRFGQYTLCSDEAFRLDTARRIVAGKIHNGLSLLRSYHYSGSNPFRFGEFETLRGLERKALDARSLDSLRGYEGTAAKCYYRGFGDVLTCGISFPGRKYYPSTDPVNAIMSFGYSFVARELQGLLEANGLDPYMGFYHEISYGRASLSLDMLEEYRHILVDRLTLKLFNKRILDADDFEVDEKDGGCYLKRDALKIFIKHYEETVNEPSVDYRGEKRSYRHIFREQAAAMRRAVSGKERYEPFRVEA